jgi:hypothetical protein
MLAVISKCDRLCLATAVSDLVMTTSVTKIGVKLPPMRLSLMAPAANQPIRATGN